MTETQSLLRVPLHALHLELGARMVPFAGYEMPVHYPAGILAEHLHTRAAASLFDVSHMGQVELFGTDAASLLESLVPGDMTGLKPGRQRYTLFTTHSGGILDDLMVANAGDRLFLVVNASCKRQDIAHLKDKLGRRIEVAPREDRALMALQGPKAEAALSALAPEAAAMSFMTWREMPIAGIPCFLSRSGYTGEDGYEISCPIDQAEALARKLLARPEVKPAGLGARDSLRLEAGLCLHGSDIDTHTTPVEADLGWSIGKRRREQGGFPGAGTILEQIAKGAPRRRVGIRPEGKAPARAHTEIQDGSGRRIGEITSGGFGPSADGPVAMGYVASEHAQPGTKVLLMVRATPREARVVALPFIPHQYKK